MRTPTKREAKNAVGILLKRHGVKVRNHKRWVNRKKKRYAKSLIASAGFDALEKRFDRIFVYANYRNRPYILTPGDPWRGRMSERHIIETLGNFAHEMTHHDQCIHNGGWINFYAKYFSDDDTRARWECAGQCANADIRAVFGRGRYNDAGHIFNEEWRKMYCLTEEQTAYAQSTFRRRTYSHTHGLANTSMGAELVEILAKVMR